MTICRRVLRTGAYVPAFEPELGTDQDFVAPIVWYFPRQELPPVRFLVQTNTTNTTHKDKAQFAHIAQRAPFGTSPNCLLQTEKNGPLVSHENWPQVQLKWPKHQTPKVWASLVLQDSSPSRVLVLWAGSSAACPTPSNGEKAHVWVCVFKLGTPL